MNKFLSYFSCLCVCVDIGLLLIYFVICVLAAHGKLAAGKNNIRVIHFGYVYLHAFSSDSSDNNQTATIKKKIKRKTKNKIESDPVRCCCVFVLVLFHSVDVNAVAAQDRHRKPSNKSPLNVLYQFSFAVYSSQLSCWHSLLLLFSLFLAQNKVNSSLFSDARAHTQNFFFRLAKTKVKFAP